MTDVTDLEISVYAEGRYTAAVENSNSRSQAKSTHSVRSAEGRLQGKNGRKAYVK